MLNEPYLAVRDHFQPKAKPAEGEHLFYFEAQIMGLPLAAVHSDSHDLLISDSSQGTFVELDPTGTLPNRDLRLKLTLQRDDQPSTNVLQTSGEKGHHGQFSLYPPLEENALSQIPLEVLFLVDTSGSMDQGALDQAILGLLECMAMLGPDDRFNVIRFADDVGAFAKKSEPADFETINAAIDYLDQLRPSGGTEMGKALEYAFDQPASAQHLRLVMFLTDGEVSREGDLVQLVARQGKDARLFSFGVGAAPNRQLLQKISAAGRGLATMIPDRDNLSDMMSQLFETIRTPTLTDIQVEWFPDDQRDMSALEMYPQVLPDLYRGRPLQARFKLDRPFQGNLLVHGNINGKPVSFKHRVETPFGPQLPALETLFGRARLDQITAQYLGTVDPTERAEHRRAALQTALDYQLVSRFTSRVAVASWLPQTPPEDPSTVTQPTAHKAAVTPFPATATNDPLRLLLSGMVLAALGCLGIARRYRHNGGLL